MPFVHRSDLKPYQRDDFDETIAFERWAEHIETSEPPRERNMITLKLLTALIAVESSGNDSALGDNGNSHGCLQIGWAVVADVNKARERRGAPAFTFPKDTYDRTKAKAICREYLNIYCTEKRLGREPTQEDAARMWNGGPNGHKKVATEKYWAKVQRELSNLK